MGEVYRVRDTRLSREVALKVLPAEVASETERLKRFEKEARLGPQFELATGRREPRKTIMPQDPAGILGADLMLTPDGKSYAYNCTREFSDLFLVTGVR